SEFAVVGLWTNPLPTFLILTTTFMINSRHIMMGAAFTPYLRHLPKRQLLPALFVMVDESWALGMAEIKRREQLGLPAFNLPYYWGTAALLYAIWIMCGYFGSIIGPMLGNIDQYGFGMAFPAVFLVLIRGMWRGFQAALPWLISLITASIVYLLIPNGSWYVIAGTLAGLLFAYFFHCEKQGEAA
ncbi:MAG: AzlC family ABC transporter permease, partial [Alysiella sp.]|uniref:AzlC family ABC transporter permease n=1 Tax=Alysiella sp. TaxID=1872483 RepID=UPI0026DB8A54